MTSISLAFSKAVYEDALSAFRDTAHPCRPMVEWQNKNEIAPFQLPEPFSGDKASLSIAFMGLNPSVSENELIPTIEETWSLDKYDSFYRSRFDAKNRDCKDKLIVHTLNGSTHKVRLWNNIELFGNNYLSQYANGTFRLGSHAILIEAVRYKSTKGWIGANAKERNRITNQEMKFTQQLIDEGAVSIVVPMGNKALGQVRKIVHLEDDMPNAIGRAMGNTYYGVTNAGTNITICPIKHMSYPPRHELQKTVAQEIISAIKKKNPNAHV